MVKLKGPKPWFPSVVSDIGESSDLVFEFVRQGWSARRVRGGKMETVDELFDEVSAAFQFPSYFGENWPAFDECINDLDWVEWRAGFAVIIAEADRVLSHADDYQLQVLVNILHVTVHDWADPERVHWAKPDPISGVAAITMPFRVVLQVDQETTRTAATVGKQPAQSPRS